MAIIGRRNKHKNIIWKKPKIPFLWDHIVFWTFCSRMNQSYPWVSVPAGPTGHSLMAPSGCKMSITQLSSYDCTTDSKKNTYELYENKEAFSFAVAIPGQWEQWGQTKGCLLVVLAHTLSSWPPPWLSSDSWVCIPPPDNKTKRPIPMYTFKILKIYKLLYSADSDGSQKNLSFSNELLLTLILWGMNN